MNSMFTWAQVTDLVSNGATFDLLYHGPELAILHSLPADDLEPEYVRGSRCGDSGR
jgi:hypothetical protein